MLLLCNPFLRFYFFTFPVIWSNVPAIHVHWRISSPCWVSVCTATVSVFVEGKTYVCLDMDASFYLYVILSARRGTFANNDLVQEHCHSQPFMCLHDLTTASFKTFPCRCNRYLNRYGQFTLKDWHVAIYMNRSFCVYCYITLQMQWGLIFFTHPPSFRP